MNVQLMVSVWARFDNTTKFYKEMDAKGFLLGQENKNNNNNNNKGDLYNVNNGYFNAWNSEARELFYQFSKRNHFDKGVDALWLDATEPEGFPHENLTVSLSFSSF